LKEKERKSKRKALRGKWWALPGGREALISLFKPNLKIIRSWML
jgi:hypothetical protein